MSLHFKILIFGATGVIGQSCLRTLPANATLVGYTYYNNQTLAKEIQARFPDAQGFDAHQFHNNYQTIIDQTKPNLIVNALAGMEGFQVSLLAAQNKINLALANKESMVMAGWWFQKVYQENKLFLAIIDSEHTSIEMLVQNHHQDIDKIYLTCSGGPYYRLTRQERNELYCPENGLVHPTWKMGPKITFDSATLFNKAFEMIEAYYLFNSQKIHAIYHSQSIVHALIVWKDQTVSALASSKNMDFATAYVLNQNQHPSKGFVDCLDFSNLSLNFKHICPNKWPPIKWANEVIQKNNRMLAIILVVLDDYLYSLFVNQKISLGEIYIITQDVIDQYQPQPIETIDDVLNFYKTLQQDVKKFLGKYQ